jgi:hypothetical protein
MDKEIIKIDKIKNNYENKLIVKNNIFPISYNHKKELRNLVESLGLTRRLSTIKSLKFDECYEKYKYSKDYEKLKLFYDNEIKLLNKGIENLQKELFNLVNKIFKFNDIKIKEFPLLEINKSYKFNYFNNIEIVKNEYKIKYSFNESLLKKNLQKNFNKKFIDKFNKVDKYINKLLKDFEESLQFGDLHQCKNIYIELKKSNKFLDELSEIQI